MGWTSYDATNYKINGKGIKVIDKKAECDSLFDDKHKVLKSAVVGNVYYAAIENDDKEVYAIVILISTSRSDGFNFGYKDMSEFCGPYETKCPKSILKLLTPTDNKWANEWRQKCWDYHNKPKLKDVKVGQKIKYKMHNGKEVVLIKREPAYQFKTPWFEVEETNTYMKKKYIPQEFEIIQ